MEREFQAEDISIFNENQPRSKRYQQNYLQWWWGIYDGLNNVENMIISEDQIDTVLICL